VGKIFLPVGLCPIFGLLGLGLGSYLEKSPSRLYLEYFILNMARRYVSQNTPFYLDDEYVVLGNVCI
jgi:hypothetical protein